MASEMGKDIAILWDSHFAASFPNSFRGALHQFFTRTLNLMAGISTLDRSSVDDEHDWGWYKDVLHNKFMNVLLSPISLFFREIRKHTGIPRRSCGNAFI